MPRFEQEITYSEGYVSSQTPEGEIPNSFGPGSHDIYAEGPGLIKVAQGQLNSVDGATVSGPANAGLVLGALGGMVGKGTVAGFQGKALIFIGETLGGAGNVVSRLGVPLGVAIPTPQIIVETSPGVYSAPYVLGLDPPAAPVIRLTDGQPASGYPLTLSTGQVLPADMTGITGRVGDTSSVKLTFRRSVTAGESNASAASNEVLPGSTGRKIVIDMPAQPSAFPGDPPNSAKPDIVRVYFTVQGFGAAGPWFLHPTEFRYTAGPTYAANEIPIAGGKVMLDYYDGDLLYSFPAPFANFRPPQGTHLFPFGPYIVIAGCLPLGGWGLAPSLPARPDAYDPDHTVRLNPGEPITACTGRATDGLQLIFTRNATHGATLSNDPSQPIYSRVLYGGDGVTGPNAVAYTESEIYFITSKGGAVHTSQTAEPDRSFSWRVAKDLGLFNPAAVVVGSDPAHNQIVFAYQTTAIAYMRGIGGDQWSAPITLPFNAVSKETFEGRLFLVLSNGTFWEWEAGAYTGEARLVTSFYDGGYANHQKTVTEVVVKASHATSVRLLGDMLVTPAVEGPDTFVVVGGGHSEFASYNESCLRSFALDMRMNGEAGVAKYFYGSEVGGNAKRHRG